MPDLALCWVICSTNDAVFERQYLVHSSGRIYILDQRLQQSKEKERSTLRDGCKILEVIVMKLFNKFGWRNRNRVEV